MKRIPVRFRGKNVGEVIENEYITYRSYKHFFRKFNGFAISDVVLQTLSQRGIKKVTIVYTGRKGRKLVLQSRMYQWIASDDVYYDGDDRQKVLNVNSMRIVRNELEKDDPILKHMKLEKPLSAFA